MTLPRIFLFLAISAAAVLPVRAQDCTIDMSVEILTGSPQLPAPVQDMLRTRLISAVSAGGFASDGLSSPYFLGARFNRLYSDILPGPPQQHAIRGEITLYVGNYYTRTIYATTTIELRGAGTSDERACANAFRSISAKNTRLLQFLDKTRAEITAACENDSHRILAEIKQAESQHDYGKALAILASVPACCSNYELYHRELMRIYSIYMDTNGQRLLRMARAAWAASPDRSGATEAVRLISLIDPESTSAAKADALIGEINSGLSADIATARESRVELEKLRIEAVKEIARAYYSEQQPNNISLTWIK